MEQTSNIKGHTYARRNEPEITKGGINQIGQQLNQKKIEEIEKRERERETEKSKNKNETNESKIRCKY